MSSLAAASADGFYYDPGWDPSKGSLNSYHGQHPLRERARMLKTQGILIIRFEMPFNVWCLHCNSHIGKGVRYNAWKKAVGKYFTTIIYEFSMKCTICDGIMVIRTDPENGTYKMVSGVKQKIQTWEEDQEAMAPSLEINHNQSNGEGEGEGDSNITNNPLALLEHKSNDMQLGKKKSSTLEKLIDIQNQKENFNLSKIARDQNRHKRKIEKQINNQNLDQDQININNQLFIRTSKDKESFISNHSNLSQKLKQNIRNGLDPSKLISIHNTHTTNNNNNDNNKDKDPILHIHDMNDKISVKRVKKKLKSEKSPLVLASEGSAEPTGSGGLVTNGLVGYAYGSESESDK